MPAATPRRYATTSVDGGEQDKRAIAAGREGMGAALDAADAHLASTPFFDLTS